MRESTGSSTDAGTSGIDFVITWVDGADPEWLRQKEHYLGETGDRQHARYREWGLLPAWLRSVERHAPWVRKIHFVTWGHLPEWLKTDHPKLHIVRHDEYIPEKYLPTFNSHTIELNMHRIPGLAEQFVYFNDDMFLLKNIDESYYFRNGLPCDCFALDSIWFGKETIGLINAHNISLINDHFSMPASLRKNWRKYFSPGNGMAKVVKNGMHLLCSPEYFPGLFYNHMPIAFLKSSFEEVWEANPQEMDQTCACKFRQNTNVNPFLIKYWQLASGHFSPRLERSCRVYHLKDAMVEQMVQDLRAHRYTVACINDTPALQNWEDAAQKTRKCMEELYPNKSIWEK